MYTLIFEADKLNKNIRLEVFRILLEHSMENNPGFLKGSINPQHLKSLENNYCLDRMCWCLYPDFTIKSYDRRGYFENKNSNIFIDLKILICMLNMEIDEIPKDRLINMIEQKCKQY